MTAVLVEIREIGRPLGRYILPMEIGRTSGKIGGVESNKSGLHTLTESRNVGRKIGSFPYPLELVRLFDHIFDRDVFLFGSVQGDMGNGNLSDLWF